MRSVCGVGGGGGGGGAVWQGMAKARKINDTYYVCPVDFPRKMILAFNAF